MYVEDFRTSAWKRLEQHLAAHLLDLREQLEHLTCNEQKTTEIRGRIAEVKELMALPTSGAVEVESPGGSWPSPDA